MKIGCVKQDITPSIPTYMAGYGERKEQAKSINDPLFAKALVIEDNDKKRAAIISIDLLCITKLQTETITKKIKELTGIKEDNVIICATHTHSGPLTFDHPIDGKANQTYVKWLIDTISGLVLQALQKLQECKLGWYQNKGLDIGGNRRNSNKKCDTYLTVLSFITSDDKLLAVLFNYNCHPTVLSAQNLKISAEFPGAAVNLLEKVYGKDVLFMFSNGACGDISTRFTRRNQTYKEKDRIGKILASEVIKSIEKIEYKKHNSFSLIQRPFKLKQREIPDEKQLNEDIDKYQRKLLELRKNNGQQGEIRLVVTALQGIKALKMLDSYKDILEYEGTITGIKLGDGCIIAQPGELFSKLGSKVIDKSEFYPTMVMGYANGSIGYIPDKTSYKDGGYESLSCHFECGSGERLVRIAGDLLKELKK